jgi:hypothetical protein
LIQSYSLSVSVDLFADGDDFSWETIQKGRNVYYQKKLAEEITIKVSEMIRLLTSVLNIHLNIGLNSTINTSEVFLSLETLSIESLSNKTVKQVGSAQIQIPSNLHLNKNQTVLLRVSLTFEFSFVYLFIQVNDGTTCCIWKISIKNKSFDISFTFNS